MNDRSVILPPDRQELKVAFAQLRRAFGGQAEAGEATGYRQQEISDWERPNVAQFPRLDAVLALEAMTVGTPGHPHVTRLAARRLGFSLVPVAPGGRADCLKTGLARIAGELGDLSEAIVAMDDPRQRRALARAVVDEASQLIDRVVQVRNLATQFLGDGN